MQKKSMVNLTTYGKLLTFDRIQWLNKYQILTPIYQKRKYFIPPPATHNQSWQIFLILLNKRCTIFLATNITSGSDKPHWSCPELFPLLFTKVTVVNSKDPLRSITGVYSFWRDLYASLAGSLKTRRNHTEHQQIYKYFN